MSDLILHHFDPSPFAEKIRLVFGLKGLAWQSVDIPMVPPKPDLTALTGGYRRTPVLQVGADIYCDTRLIALELERRFPTPTLFPGATRGLVESIDHRLALAERRPVRRDAGDRNHPRSVTADERTEGLTAVDQFFLGQLRRLGGRSTGDIGDADPPVEQVPAVRVGHAEPAVDLAVDDARP